MGLNYAYHPNTPLLRIGRRSFFTIGSSYTGAFICGGSGSGKTSGSCQALALAMLRAGYGGLILCAKPSERGLWESYAARTGRTAELFIVDGRTDYCFNFLNYELYRPDPGGSTANAVALFMKILEASRLNRQSSQGGDQFWTDSVSELLSHAIDALFAAYGRVSLDDIMKMAHSAPVGLQERSDPGWQANSFCFQTLEKAWTAPIGRPLSVDDFNVVNRYFMETYCTLSDRTRSSINVTLSSMIRPFMKGGLRRIFNSSTTVVPEMCTEGALLLIDLSVKEWGHEGVIAQHVFKYTWQRAMERRRATLDPKARPVFLFADEAQFFISPLGDEEFQSTARESRACTVYATQSIEALYKAIGGPDARHTVGSLLTNFRTKILHANDNQVTNEWSAELIGKDIQHRGSWGRSRSDNLSYGVSSNSGGGSSGNYSPGSGSSSGWSNNWSYGNSYNESNSIGSNSGIQETIDYVLQPAYFSRYLRNGGPNNRYLVDGIVYQGGHIWPDSGTNWIRCAFPQKL